MGQYAEKHTEKKRGRKVRDNDREREKERNKRNKRNNEKETETETEEERGKGAPNRSHEALLHSLGRTPCRPCAACKGSSLRPAEHSPSAAPGPRPATPSEAPEPRLWFHTCPPRHPLLSVLPLKVFEVRRGRAAAGVWGPHGGKAGSFSTWSRSSWSWACPFSRACLLLSGVGSLCPQEDLVFCNKPCGSFRTQKRDVTAITMPSLVMSQSSPVFGDHPGERRSHGLHLGFIFNCFFLFCEYRTLLSSKYNP